MAAISLRAVTKRYGDTVVVPAIDLAIRDQEFVVFVGPSGCGKSTLLRLIAGLEPVDAGDLYIGETRVNDMAPAERDIAMVFQDYALYPHMSVYQNMAFGLEMRGMPKRDIAARVAHAAELLRITPFLQRKPRALSGGQRQRVAMGRAMVRDPKVFLFDEPLSNLDAKLRAEVRTEIKALAQELHTTMIFVTHDQVEAMTMADRMVVLKAGVVQQFDTPDGVYRHPANQFVAGFIGSPTMNFFNITVGTNDVRLAGGERLALPPETLARLHASSHRTATLGIRAEQWLVNVANANEADGALRVRVSVVEPLGSDTLAYFDYDSQRHVVRLPPTYAVAVGDTLALGIAHDQLHLFDATNGDVLR